MSLHHKTTQAHDLAVYMKHMCLYLSFFLKDSFPFTESICFLKEGTLIHAALLTENTVFLMDVKVCDEGNLCQDRGMYAIITQQVLLERGHEMITFSLQEEYSFLVSIDLKYWSVKVAQHYCFLEISFLWWLAFRR